MTWEPFVVHTSTEHTVTAVIRSRSRHWEETRHTGCRLDDCELHPEPLTSFELDPDQGFWRNVRAS